MDLKKVKEFETYVADGLLHSTFFAKPSLHNFLDLFIIDTSTKVQLCADYRVAQSLSSGVKPCFHESDVAGLDL